MLSILAMVTRGHKNETSSVAARMPEQCGTQASGLEIACHSVHWIHLSPSSNRGQAMASSASLGDQCKGKVSHSLDIDES